MTAPKAPRKFYRKKRWLTVLLLAALACCVLVIMPHYDLSPLLLWAGKKSGVEIHVDSTRLNLHSLRVQNMVLNEPGNTSSFARIQFLEVTWNYLDLLAGKIDSINLQGPSLSLKELEHFQTTQAKKAGIAVPSQSTATTPSKNSWFKLTIGTLIVRNGQLMLDNLGVGMPVIPIDIASVDPIVLNNLTLGGKGKDGSSGTQEDQTITVENLIINSPYDPLTSILKFERISLTFNWEGIQRQHIKSLQIKNPTVYIGPDLFYFADQIQAAAAAEPKPATATSSTPAEPATPWTIDHFRLWGGKLMVYSFGKPGFLLPMIFAAETDNMVLDNFANLPFNKLGFDIPSTDLSYPNLDLKIRGLSGSLFIGLPLTDPKAQNLTPNVEIEEADWKGVKATNIKTFVTFSRDGILTKLWGTAEKGHLQAGVYVDLTDFTWSGWGSVDRAMLDNLTRMLSPDNFTMDGKASGRFIVHGKLSEIIGLGGELTLPGNGVIHIVSVNDVLKKLPGDWWQPKREAVKALLEAFENYNYTNGTAEFTYAPPESFLKLSLDGKQGKRNFDLRWHDQREKPGLGF